MFEYPSRMDVTDVNQTRYCICLNSKTVLRFKNYGYWAGQDLGRRSQDKFISVGAEQEFRVGKRFREKALQQYVGEFNNIFNIIKSNMNSTVCGSEWSQTESQLASEGAVSRNAVKPWVFRPKKVIYSLEEVQTTTRKQYSKSHWSEDENDKYVEFLLKFKSVLEGGKKNRRKWHLNRMMSKAISSRSHEQCRSHHQKMIKHYRTIEGIIAHLTKNEVAPLSEPNEAHSNLEVEAEVEEEGGLEESRHLNFWDFDQMQNSLGVDLPFYYQPQPLI